jgi:hypothetical protein
MISFVHMTLLTSTVIGLFALGTLCVRAKRLEDLGLTFYGLCFFVCACMALEILVFAYGWTIYVYLVSL